LSHNCRIHLPGIWDNEAMAHPEYIRQKAITLRVDRKLTIDEIAERLALPKTTIYYWVKDIPIPRKPNVRIPSAARVKGTIAMQAKYTAKREAAYREGVEEFPLINQEPTFRDFICMYIGEGYKRNRNCVSICNSDPMVVKLGNDWIKRFSSNPVTYAVQFHADQSMEELACFWAQLLAIEPDEVKFQRKSNSSQLKFRTWRSKHGVLTVRTGDTYFRARLQAWMDLVKQDWE